MITAWSPSKLTEYEECPLRCKLKTVDKLCPICFAGTLRGFEVQTCTKCGGSPVKGAALDRGTLLHKEAENFISGKAPAPHKELLPVADWLTRLRSGFRKGLVRLEVELALTKAWTPTTWFGKDAWLRTKIDVQDMTGTLKWKVIDWKTGKFKPDGEFSDQLNIYSTALLSAFPQPKTIESSLVFIDAGQEVERPEGTVKRKDLAKAQKRWEARTKAMMADTIFPPKPSYGCKWCPFAKSKGGPCQY
jgi:CRISPR/Cas system-associated exonuclease Cas4 (RecB family)